MQGYRSKSMQPTTSIAGWAGRGRTSTTAFNMFKILPFSKHRRGGGWASRPMRLHFTGKHKPVAKHSSKAALGQEAGKLTCDPRSIMIDKYISLRMYMRSISNTCSKTSRTKGRHHQTKQSTRLLTTGDKGHFMHFEPGNFHQLPHFTGKETHSSRARN